MKLPFSVTFDFEAHYVPKGQWAKDRAIFTSDVLKDIARETVERLGPDYCILDRCEPVIASRDLKSQLRQNLDDLDGPATKAIFRQRWNTVTFDQLQSEPNSYFTIEDLAKIVTVMKERIEHRLGYEMLEPIIFIEARKVSNRLNEHTE